MRMPVPEAGVIARRAAIVARLRAVIGAGTVIDDPVEARAYECDALSAYRCPPLAVALPETEAQVAAVLKACHRLGVPVVARGAGTGLSGGAMPHEAGLTLAHDTFFDTVTVQVSSADEIVAKAAEEGFNLRRVNDEFVGISVGESTTDADIAALTAVFTGKQASVDSSDFDANSGPLGDADLLRTDDILTHPIFHSISSETQMMRYLRMLADRDLALDRTMIPLGSCTMKLNAAAEMMPITWPEFGALHPGVLKSLDADGPMLAFEIVLDAVPEPRGKAGKTRGAADLAKLTPLTRDFAFVVEEAKPAGDLVRAAAGADKTLITEVRVFDVYRGKGVEDVFKSVALEVVIQPRDATLTEAEIEDLATWLGLELALPAHLGQA